MSVIEKQGCTVVSMKESDVDAVKPVPGISGFVGMEFCSFRLKQGVSETDLLGMAHEVAESFLSHQDGFLGHVLLKDGNGRYADVLFASSQVAAEKICHQWMDNTTTLEYLEFIDHDTINLSFWSRLK